MGYNCSRAGIIVTTSLRSRFFFESFIYPLEEWANATTRVDTSNIEEIISEISEIADNSARDKVTIIRSIWVFKHCNRVSFDKHQL